MAGCIEGSRCNELHHRSLFGFTVFASITLAFWWYLQASTGAYAATSGFFVDDLVIFSLPRFLVDEFWAILFTVLAFKIWFEPGHFGVVGDAVSIAVDVGSLFQDWKAAGDLAGGSEELIEWGSITYASDVAADMADVVAAGHDLYISFYG